MIRRGVRGIAAALTTVVVAMSITIAGAEAAPKNPKPTPTAEPTPSPSPTASPTPAPQPMYVALGDSYAAGTGAGSYLQDSSGCYRSLKGYPGLVATEKGYALNLQACSGAVTADVLDKQLTSSLTDASYVTITIGGNDVGFASIMTTCMGSNEAACLSAVQTAVEVTKTDLPSRLDAVFSAVKTEAPSAAIVATNYPHLLSPVKPDCSWLTAFTKNEVTAINSGADTLSDTISAAAGRAGIRFADVREPFTGHAVCDSSSWINNASLATYQSFHPNATGYASGYKPTVAGVLGGTATGTAATVTTGGTTSSDTTRGMVKLPKD
ncbi:hypothetical protein BCR15_11755 [Tessaracoccus lapidicaptus]|uniref:Uncharacterized protein n=1 Tax=Tessaracoccus lapidicaptus TaxID=1427523 RepID=A0A1C0AS79_9ACTN|nr:MULTISPECIES: SGNH/GDSL hydrolase family protein [Tessaracoccus]AQX15851.1 hypothetical protein BKM78_07900 [Tessaracoccus sp. T2.5-30]OCL37129.1 hypothetical protein BCR15_11755 [Tessaracoccus lapidicaptus]VEP40304.1 Lipase 1 [Tessaracoccus lapidicaptus]